MSEVTSLTSHHLCESGNLTKATTWKVAREKGTLVAGGITQTKAYTYQEVGQWSWPVFYWYTDILICTYQEFGIYGQWPWSVVFWYTDILMYWYAPATYQEAGIYGQWSLIMVNGTMIYWYTDQQSLTPTYRPTLYQTMIMVNNIMQADKARGWGKMQKITQPPHRGKPFPWIAFDDVNAKSIKG